MSSSMPSTKMLILEAARNLNTTNLTIATILSQMQLLASQLPEYSVVSAMKGVGERLSVLLIAELAMYGVSIVEVLLWLVLALMRHRISLVHLMEQNVIFQSVAHHS